MNKKNVFLWTLYDYANSLVTIVFFLHFSQWLVIDNGVADFWYNMIFTVGSILLLLTAPVLGGIADKNGKQQDYLNGLTVFIFIFFLLASLTTLFFSDQVFLAALFFLIASYLYQFSFVFYNALLHYIAPPEKWGFISGIGQAGNWLGQISGLLITLPLATGAVYLVGEAGRAQAFLPAAVLFFILALPMLLYFKLPKQVCHTEKISLAAEYKDYWRKFKDLVSSPNVGLFLLAYFFFNDAIVTVVTNFPIYLEKVFAVPDDTKSLLIIGILGTSAVGALCSGWIADKVGLKKTLMVVLGSWVILFPLMGLTTDFNVFTVLMIMMGFLYGSVWTITRASMTALCPKEKLNFGFGFYTLAERASTLVGPLAWGLITYIFIELGSDRYRIAIAMMAVFVLIGVLLMKKVTIKK